MDYDRTQRCFLHPHDYISTPAGLIQVLFTRDNPTYSRAAFLETRESRLYNYKMKKYRWQLLILFITGLVVGLLLILERRGGLGEVSAPLPVEGGVYTEALVGGLQRLNPLLDDTNSVDRDIDSLIFSGLIKFDSRGVAQPDLAESIGVSQDGTLYNILLREDLTWHDGEPLTTDDILFTIDLIIDGKTYISDDVKNLWNSIDVNAFDDLNMQIRLPEAYAPFMDYLAFGVLPKHVFGQMNIDQIVNSSMNLQPIGSGPYQFSELLTDEGMINGISLKAYEKYYGEKPFLQEVVFRFYQDQASAYQAYKDGYVQGICEITSDLLPDALSSTSLSIYTGRLPRISMVMFNLNDQGVPFLQDVKVRKALLLGINRAGLVSEIFNGQAIVANSVILPETWAYNENIPPVSYDQAQAELLLKQAGYVVTGETNPIRKKGDAELKLVLSYPEDELHEKIANYIARDWAKLEIEVVLEPVPTDLYISEKLDSRGFQAALVDINLSQTPDPDPYPFWDLGQATNGQNYSQWSNRFASDSLEQARVTSDITERTRLYHNFQMIFADELPALPLYYPVYNYAVDAQIQGVTMGPLFDTSGRFASITRWFISARRGQETTQTPTGN